MADAKAGETIDEEAAHKLCLLLAIRAWRLIATAHGESWPLFKENPVGDSLFQREMLRFQNSSINDNTAVFGVAVGDLRNAWIDYAKMFNVHQGLTVKRTADGSSLHEGCGGRFGPTWHDVALSIARDAFAIVDRVIPRAKILIGERVSGPDGIVPGQVLLAKLPEQARAFAIVLTAEMRTKVHEAITRTFTPFSIEQLHARMEVEYAQGKSVEEQFAEETARETPNVSRKRRKKRRIDAVTESRDKWIYEQCCRLVPYDTIAIRLKKKPVKWLRIESKQGIRHAAQRYAKRHGLQKIPVRQDAQ